MASCSSSKAAETPEWKSNLDAVVPQDRCQTQNNIIRAVALLDDLVDECTKSPPPTIKDVNRAVKLVAGFLEVKSLGIQDMSILLIYPEKDKLIGNTVAKLASEHAQILRNSTSDSSLPTDTETLPTRLFMLLHLLLLRTEDALGVYRRPSSDDDRYWASIRRLSLGTPQWAVDCLNELKTSGGDLLLKQLGSNLTVDQLLAWSKLLNPAQHIAKYLLAEDSMQMVLPMLDKVTEWLETFTNAPPADNYSWYLARSIVSKTLDMTCSSTVVRLASPQGAELMEKIEQKRCTLTSLTVETFAKKLVAARAAVPQDPVQIASFSIFCASLTVADYDEGQKVSKRCMDFVVESRAAAQRAKPWLPPAIYKFFNIFIKGLENLMQGVYQDVGEANKKIHESALATQAKLEECCNVCKAAGREFALKCCSQCRKVYYCSKECQKKDWKLHKKVCKSLAEAGEKE